MLLSKNQTKKIAIAELNQLETAVNCVTADSEITWCAMTSKRFCPTEDLLPARLLKGYVLVLVQTDSAEVVIKSSASSQTNCYKLLH